MHNTIIKEFTYHVPANVVWQALTETGKMKIWYFPQLLKFVPKVGAKFEFYDDHSEYQKEWTVTQVIQGKILAHNWAYKNYPGSSEVIFEILGNGDETKLRITQTNLDSFPQHPYFARERFEWGWNNLLGKNLKELLENT